MKKLYSLFALLIVLSMLLGACGPTAAPVVETEVVVPVVEPTAVPTAVPTEVPPTEVPTPVPPDFTALFSALVDALPADAGYGATNAVKLNEALADKPPFLLDVREVADIEKDGFIAGAVNIPLRDVLSNLDKLPGLDEPIVVYCTSGHRAGTMTAALRILGYTDVKNLGGGMNAWKKANLAVEAGQPAAATALSTPIIADQPLWESLNAFYAGMPEGYYALPVAKVAEALTASPAPVLLDVRTQAEWDKDGYIEGATLIPFNDFFKSLDKLPADKAAPVVVYCGSGHRGAIIMMAMRMLGYADVNNLAGGLGAWKAGAMPVVGWVDWSAVWTEYLAAMPEGYFTIKAADLNTALAENPPFLLDVREAAEVEAGFISGAVHISVREVLKNLDKLPAQDAPIVIYCASGARGAMVMSALQMLGYTNVKNLAGGTGGWVKAEFTLETGTPAAPVAGTAPEVDATRLRDLDAFLANLPDGFYTVKSADLATELTGTPVPAIFDVRTVEEQTAGGIIAGATAIKFQELPANLSLLPAKDQPIVMLCQSGHRGAIAMMYLRMVGYTNVRNLAGGMNAWVAAELPVVK